jgi:hypothetical protein
MKMIRWSRSAWMLALLVVLAAAVGAATLRAVAQSVMTGPRVQREAATAPADQAEPSDQAASSDQTRPSSDRASPPATQPKDTTAPAGAKPAPDIRGSADNNVSFPVDI